jgi:GNAT superfamily N-acetyltransferase
MSIGGPERPVGGLSVRPPAGVELRPAARGDLEAVLGLLADREGLPVPQLDPETAEARWEAFLGSVDAVPFLALADGDPAGLLLLSFRRRLNFATWEAWVPELVVAKAHRRRGIGRALLRVAVEEWRLRGAHRLSIDLGPGDAAGSALVATLGFEDAFLRFRQDPLAPTVVPPPRGVTVRSLTREDFEGATRLVAEMGPHHSPVPERMPAVERSFREIASHPNAASLVATRDDEPIGIATIEIRPSLRYAAPEAWLPELVVTERERGQGIGRALLGAALTVASARGAGGAVLESGHQRAVAQALYRSFGFEDAGRVFTLLRDH